MNHEELWQSEPKDYPKPLDDTALASTWNDAWSWLGCRPDDELRASLMSAWAEPHRHYHDQQHLRECMAYWVRWKGLADRAGEVALAIWFHDAVYEPRASGNELESASWAARSIVRCGAGSDAAQRVYDLVMATVHDASVDASSGIDTTLLVDIDLSILGARAERFDQYDQDVAKEYAWVPASRYRAGRAQVLTRFLERPRLYRTDAAAALLETAARMNLARALARLAQ